MLTFQGFLKQYIKSISYCESYCLKKIDKEADRNYRVVAPEVLYIKITHTAFQQDMLQSKRLNNAFTELENYNNIEAALQQHLLKEDYQKIYNSYLVRKNRHKTETDTKALIHKKIRFLQTAKNISNYRIYTDLHLNHGNVNDFLTNGNTNKISLDNAKKILEYVTSA